jgi:hypothetical protein
VTSPTQRSLAKLRADGWNAEVVERFNPHAGPHGIRQDLFGFIDVVALGDTILAVQATSTGVAARKAKILALEAETGIPGRWVRSGGRLEVWGWAKRRARERNADGTRSKRQEVRLRVLAFGWDVASFPPALTVYEPAVALQGKLKPKRLRKGAAVGAGIEV